MMKYKRLLISIILVVVFSFLWLHLNHNHLSTLEELGIQGLIFLTSAYAGYNCIISHGSMYVIFFLLLVILCMPKDSVQVLVRKKRTEYILLEYKRMFWITLQFLGIFMGVFVFFTVLFENNELLLETGFWSGVGMLAIFLLLYYFFIGAIFIFFDMLMFSNSKSFVATFITSVLLLCLSMFKKTWTPVSGADIFDLLLDGGLYMDGVVINMGKIILLIAAILCITCIIFKDKDVLHEKI